MITYSKMQSSYLSDHLMLSKL